MLGWCRGAIDQPGACGRLFTAAAPPDREPLLINLHSWRSDPGLAGVRDPASVAGYPEDEQTAIAGLWAAVAAVLRSGNAKHEAYLRERLAAGRQALPTDSPDLAYLLAQLGRVLLDQEQWKEAEEALAECLAIRERAAPDSWTTFNTLSSIGGALLGQKRYADAEPLLVKGYRGMKDRQETIPAVGKDRLPEAVERLVRLYEAVGKGDETARFRAELPGW